MTTIQIRIDEKTKARAKKVFSKMGLDVSSGIKLYLSRVVQDKGLPFTPREFTPTAADKRALARARKNFRDGKMLSHDEFVRAMGSRR